MKIMNIVGARPQFVKAAMVSKALRKRKIKEVLVHTGQHFDKNMSELFFSELKLKSPNHNLGISSLSHGKMTGLMLDKLEELMIRTKPDLVIVYGDTNSTAAGALAAAKLNIPIAHVEAGMRSFDRRMPEEVNRVVTDHLSSLHFCSTNSAIENLANEGIKKGVYKTGDIMYDSYRYINSLIRVPILLDHGDFYLATIHRAANTDDKKKLQNIFEGFARLCRPVVFPIHPRTKTKVAEYNIKPKNVKLIIPVGRAEFQKLLNSCRLVLTDSGGVQKEAYFSKKACVTVREHTEWVESLGKWNVLCKADPDDIVRKVKKMENKKIDFSKKIYGNGKTAERIADIIIRYLK